MPQSDSEQLLANPPAANPKADTEMGLALHGAEHKNTKSTTPYTTANTKVTDARKAAEARKKSKESQQTKDRFFVCSTCCTLSIIVTYLIIKRNSGFEPSP